MGSVVFLDWPYVAACPKCRNVAWHICVNSPHRWEHLTGFECTNCGFAIDLQPIETREVENGAT